MPNRRDHASPTATNGNGNGKGKDKGNGNGIDEARQAAADAGLTYVSDEQPGIHRRRAGKGFSYAGPDGETVRDDATLQRVRGLAIPPAYHDVWICPDPDGHLQATGRDDRDRKQYRYHPQWQQARGSGKFDRVIAFGDALPRLRRRLRRDLALPGLPREKVLAVVVSVMAETLLRVGNAIYARSNKSFGLTTLRNQHVAFSRGGRARFRFRGKSGLEHDIELDDARLAKLIRRCRQLPGQSLFQYQGGDGELQPVDSSAVNAYVQDAMGEDFSAKDFRTWGGTLAAFQAFAATPLPTPARGRDAPSERALAAAQNEVIKQVAQVLGNTPAVCRSAYVDPAVLEGWRDGRLHKAADSARGVRQWEQAALKFLSKTRNDALREARRAA